MVGKGGEIPLHSFYTHTFSHTSVNLLLPRPPSQRLSWSRKGWGGGEGEKPINQVCSLHLESCVLLERGVSLKGRVPGKRVGWP